MPTSYFRFAVRLGLRSVAFARVERAAFPFDGGFAAAALRTDAGLSDVRRGSAAGARGSGAGRAASLAGGAEGDRWTIVNRVWSPIV